MKRKSVLAILSLILLLSMILSACGNEAAPQTKSPEPTGTINSPEPTDEAVNLPGFKLGLVVYTNTGGWFDRIYDGIKTLADATGSTISLASGATPDEAVAAVENLCASGVDGIIDLATGGVSHRLLQICQDYGVYFVAANNNLLLEEGYETFRKNDYYVGSVYADDKQVSYDIVKDMIDNGAKKLAVFGLPPGISAAFDNRFAGAYEALDEAGMTVLTEARSFVMPEAVQNLLTQFPDVDAIFSAVDSSNYLYQPLISGGYGGKIQINSFDDGSDVSIGFDNGIVSHAVEGVNAQAQIAYILLYNALTENKMVMGDGSAPDILMPYVLLHSTDEFKDYVELSKGGLYSLDELEEYVVLKNPDADLDKLITLAKSLGK
ncbi:MAG: substrate-binding domain-containing protein [Clostridiales bacterium]|jgi:ABC-type sugar transport system substrate-binding protein|nr:substrate-binding domain-containing protein [Clostridiales bacterium]